MAGIVSSISKSYENDKWDSVESFCGGIPKCPKPPLSYIKVFYPGGVIKEFSGVAQERRNGTVVNVPARSGKELIFIPGFGVLEAVVTSGGLSLTPEYSNLNTLSYKTLRYPGHIDYLNQYVFTQPDPTKVLCEILEEVGSDNPDVVILHFRVTDKKGGNTFRTFLWEYDVKNNFSAMSQATGYTAAAVATMIKDGLIKKGVIGMHDICAEEIIRRARWMENQYMEI